jgi:hypothetical protein
MNLQENINRIKSIMKSVNSDINEVSEEGYQLILDKYSESRLIMTEDTTINFREFNNQKIGYKPKGLWYGIGVSWIDWVRNEMPDWEYDNIFKIDLNESNMLMIDTLEKLYSFNKEFGAYFSQTLIDWKKVSNSYGGIEISPYMWPARMELDWYYGWDVASGCVWNKNVIQNIEKII